MVEGVQYLHGNNAIILVYAFYSHQSCCRLGWEYNRQRAPQNGYNQLLQGLCTLTLSLSLFSSLIIIQPCRVEQYTHLG